MLAKRPDGDVSIIDQIRAHRGLIAAIARACGLTHQAVRQWKNIPPQHVTTVAPIIGLTPEEIRPDIFGPKPVPPMTVLKPPRRPRKT